MTEEEQFSSDLVPAQEFAPGGLDLALADLERALAQFERLVGRYDKVIARASGRKLTTKSFLSRSLLSIGGFMLRRTLTGGGIGGENRPQTTSRNSRFPLAHSQLMGDLAGLLQRINGRNL